MIRSNDVNAQVERKTVWYHQASLKSNLAIQSACLSLTASDLTPAPSPTVTRIVGRTPEGSPTVVSCASDAPSAALAEATIDPCVTPDATASPGTTELPTSTVTPPASEMESTTVTPTPAAVAKGSTGPISSLPNTGAGAEARESGGTWAFVLLLSTLVLALFILRIDRARRQ